ncbi:murein L,D-transpeptidase [Vibrio navarrensis]|uniref:L,D-transpeptidase family protein n=1 Tax=Vibrio navarrensis TaxID=29495 RepID=UPI0018680C20|nr:L,D-transpeptidase family protein [Vibrio navarrensis]MBE3663992.1 murein L,D-transpeptidase [Vibrio navarrensis]
MSKSLIVLLLVLLAPPLWALTQQEDTHWRIENSAALAYVQYPHQVEQLYREHGHQRIWTDARAIEQFEFQLELVKTAGVSPYFEHQIAKLNRYKAQQQWLGYDILATDILLSYLSYLDKLTRNGKDWLFASPLSQSLPAPNPRSLSNLAQEVRSDSLADYIASLRSPLQLNPQFEQRYRKLWNVQHQVTTEYLPQGLKKVGDPLTDKAILLRRLQMVGIDTSVSSNTEGLYDESLAKAIKQFQKMHGLAQDGIIGPATVKWLNVSPAQRLHSMALNAERSRLWPQERDLLILVNVPGYEMQFWYKGEEVFESKVVVGKISRKTPIMEGKMDGIVLNPVWNVPNKIMVKDILPKLKRDQNYLKKQNIEILPAWDSETTIDPESIDWSRVSRHNFPYKMRQLSGSTNALGLYKFNIPNKRAIFLHDTPSKRLFSRDHRAFSSGCVRVENADQFAHLLLQTQGLEEELTRQSAWQEPNNMIPLKTRVPVHIIYQTVWFDGEEINYRDDIYQFDLIRQQG